MHAALALGVIAFLICLLITPLCRDICLRFDLVDHPDGSRKLHLKPVPRMGGIAIALSYGLTLALAIMFAPHGVGIFIHHRLLFLSLLPSALLVFITGFVDDVVGLSPKMKLAGICVAATLAVALGARITLVNGHLVSAWISIPFSIVWLLLCSNALNLIDGLDGLATGVALFATLTTTLTAILQGNAGLAIATIPLAACLLAFLRYNFNPASIFLGDCGSLTIGFMLGCFGLIWSQKSATFLGMAAPMMMLALPLLDVSLAIGRRYLSSRPIFQADRGHIHHRLLALGCKPRQAALILYAVCGVAAVLSLLQSLLSNRYQGLTIVCFCLFAIYGVNRLKYAEFRAAKQLLSRRNLLRVLEEQTYLEGLRQSIEQVETVEECWRLVCSTCKDLNFVSAEMEFDGRTFAGVLDMSSREPAWQMTVSLSLGVRGELRLTRVVDCASPSLMMSALYTLQQQFVNKQIVFQTLEPSAEESWQYIA